MKKDDFGDRMKRYEKLYAGQKAMPLLPVIARLDGKNFSKLTKNLDRPFDGNFRTMMKNITRLLVGSSNALLGYTQSDEITLVYYSDDYKKQIFFNGKIQKMVSVLASMATSYANFVGLNTLLKDPIIHFDCRVFQVPTKVEAANQILWRVQDAVRNSIQAVGQHNFSHKELMHKGSNDIQEMLWKECNINWNDFPVEFKEGYFIQRRKHVRAFTDEEIEKLPEKHQARTNPDLMIERTDINRVDLSPFKGIVNKTVVIFDGAKPSWTNWNRGD